ncbi:GntR family transcriptional regulator [Mycolicibacterium smegmatis]|uniref:GntR family transcriptional regulator n=1 Tax=Mycolicibacterium smegmatis TaxID=1772 RepID=UPI001E524A05|nr:GntR family transcriptional regulator [Mycolicibacterium smegmatis]
MDVAAGALRAARRLRLKDDVLAVLRDAIIAGKFAPGERLNEKDLAEQLGTSRGPIRDSLAALAHEGLVVHEPHKGARVPPLDKADIEDVYTLRVALETLAARTAVERARAADFDALDHALSDLAEAFEKGDRRGITDADLRFHDAFYQAAHHDRLSVAWRTVRSQVALCLFSRNTVSATSREIVVDEHVHLLDLLRTRSESALVDAVRAHIETAYQRLVASYD